MPALARSLLHEPRPPDVPAPSRQDRLLTALVPVVALLKDAGPDLLAQAVHAAVRGDALIAPGVTARLLDAFAGAAPAAPPAQPVDPADRPRGGEIAIWAHETHRAPPRR